MEQKTSEFDKVLGAWDILGIAFGAMIGWGWEFLPATGLNPVVCLVQLLHLQSVES